MALASKFFAKVYSWDGSSYKFTLDSSLFTSLISFTREVGKPASDVNFDLAVPSDQCPLLPFDLVKVYAANDRNPAGVLVYSGHVMEPGGVLSASGSDHSKVRLYPVESLLSCSSWVKSGSRVVTYSNANVATIFTDAVTAANTAYGSLFSYSAESTSVTASISQDTKTFLDWLNYAKAPLGNDWRWRALANGKVELGQWDDSSPDHKFTVGLDADTLDVSKSLLRTYNRIVLKWGSSQTSVYDDAASIALYGLREKVITDSGVTDQTSADAVGASNLSALSSYATKAEAVINSRYAIETILPGDTCKFRNLRDASGQMLSGTYRIVRVTFDGVTANLQLSTVVDSFGSELGSYV